jgi:hypothetical protein
MSVQTCERFSVADSIRMEKGACAVEGHATTRCLGDLSNGTSFPDSQQQPGFSTRRISFARSFQSLIPCSRDAVPDNTTEY